MGLLLYLLGALGPSIFGATLVACLLAEKVETLHITLMVIGALFTLIGKKAHIKQLDT